MPFAPGPTATDLFLNGKSQELIERMAKDETRWSGLGTPRTSPRPSPSSRS